MGKRAPQSPSNSTWNLNLIHLVLPPLRFLWNLNSLHLISRQHSLLFLRWVHMKARLCHLHSPLDMKTYSFLEKRSRTVEKRAVCVHCVIFPPINTAGGYYIFNGYSINCSSFFSLSGAEELFDLMFRPPRLFDIIIPQSRWIKLLQANRESWVFVFIKCKIACLQQINSLALTFPGVTG